MFGVAAGALVPGGHLFFVGVDLIEHGRRGPGDPNRLYMPERLGEALEGLDVLRCESVKDVAESTEGPPGRRSMWWRSRSAPTSDRLGPV